LTLDIFGKRIAAAEKELAEASALWIQSNEIMAFYRDAAEDSRVKSSSFSDLAGRSGEIELAINRKSDLGLRFGEAAKNILSVENEIESMRAGLNPLLDRIIIDGQKEIDALNKSKDDIEWDINFLDKKLAVLSENLIRLEKDKDRLEEHQTQIKAVKKEIEEWSYLRATCGKNGLQALEIDGAAPLITTEANTILADAFGLDNQIKIVTQDPETGREVFWIKVIREDGSEDDFGNLSGGQRVWIAHALSLGMTLVSKRKSGRDFRTLFMDECDGALDEKKAVDFIKLYRAMLKTGDFDTCIFISHKPELISMADHVIDFGKMGD
jgi:exonuclease SbcC